MNIEFRYLYRDCGNWKNHGMVVLRNESELNKEEIIDRLMLLIGDDQFIDVQRLKLPPLYFPEFPYDPELDHEAHEFFDVSDTDSPVNDLEHRDIVGLLAAIEAAPL